MSQERLICKPDGHNSNVWYIGTHDELLVATVNHICAEDFAKGLVDAWNSRRITPPTDTTGSGREGETPDTDAAKKYSVQLYPHQNGAIETVSADFARQLERQRNAALAQVEALRRDGERLQWLLDLIAEHGTDGLQSFPWSILDDPANDPDEDDPDRLTPILDRAAIDSAQRQEGAK